MSHPKRARSASKQLSQKGSGGFGDHNTIFESRQRLARREKHHGDLASRSGLVRVVVGPVRCHDRPYALPFFGRRSPRPDRNYFVPHLDLHIGVREQVFVPDHAKKTARRLQNTMATLAIATNAEKVNPPSGVVRLKGEAKTSK